MIWTVLAFAALMVTLIVAIRKSRQRRYQDLIFLTNLQLAVECIKFLNEFADYVTWPYRDKIKKQYSDQIKFFKGKEKFYKKEKNVQLFNDIFSDFDHYIINYNRNFVEAQKSKLDLYFDNIEGKKLDDQQRNAVIVDEYSNLIIAGAGSGKTLTILGKIKYLIEDRHVKGDEILLLSFTEQTVNELNERLQDLGVPTKASTFHKLGYDIIKLFQEQPPKVTNENMLGLIIKDYLYNDIFEDTEALESFIQYVACYMNVPEEEDEYDSLGEKLDVEKGIDLRTLRSKCDPLNKVAKPALDTLQGEKVKSVQELTIANFFYLNGIDYIYEKQYPHADVVYCPDFYLPEYDIWLEHFGVDENNRATWLTLHNEKKYVEGMEWKRKLHESHGTKLLETYSYFSKNNMLLPLLKALLEKENVVFSPRDPKTIYEQIASNEERLGSEMIKLIQSFVNLSKSRKVDRKSLISLFSNGTNAKNDFMLERQKMFLKFVLPILEKYDKVLHDKNEIDFNDMINHATDAIKTRVVTSNYKYIIIDEYQDISFSRFNLIKEIRDKTGARLICVGDDWQSIYRFAGSDVSLFQNFEKYVGKHEKLLIEQTYRNSQSLIDITAHFIQKNDQQIS